MLIIVTHVKQRAVVNSCFDVARNAEYIAYNVMFRQSMYASAIGDVGILSCRIMIAEFGRGLCPEGILSGGDSVQGVMSGYRCQPRATLFCW